MWATPRFVKRRRTTFRRRRIGKRKTATLTSQHGRGATMLAMFRRKPFSARRYQRQLFRQTDSRAHYRSIRSIASALTTNNVALSLTASDVRVDFPLQYLGANFWTAAGGASSNDPSVALPTFSNSTIVIRGGSIWYTFFNEDPTSQTDNFSGDGIKLKLWFGYTNERVANVPAAFPISADNSWDPTILADLSENYGKIYYATEVLISPGQCFEFKRRLRPHKLEYNTFVNGGNQPFIFWQAINMKAVGGASNAVYTIKGGYNLSFSADAV